MNTIAINQKPTTRTNYIGCEEGAVPVTVYRKAKFVVVHVGEPAPTNFFGKQSEFRDVKFVELGTSKVFENSLYDGHYARLADTLATGNTVEIEYEVGSHWIKSVNNQRWN